MSIQYIDCLIDGIKGLNTTINSMINKGIIDFKIIGQLEKERNSKIEELKQDKTAYNKYIRRSAIPSKVLILC